MGNSPVLEKEGGSFLLLPLSGEGGKGGKAVERKDKARAFSLPSPRPKKERKKKKERKSISHKKKKKKEGALG